MTQPQHILDQIRAGAPRLTVRVQFPDGRILEGPKGLPLEAYIQCAENGARRQVVAAQLGDHLADLNEKVLSDANVQLVPLTSDAGYRIHQRSMVFLLDVAARELYPEARISVEHALTYGGLYCRVQNRPPFNSGELCAIEARMRAIVAADEFITRATLDAAQARAYFEQTDPQKNELLEQSPRPHIQLHSLRGVRKFFFDELLVPSTGYLPEIALAPYRSDFALQFPSRGGRLRPPGGSERLSEIFREYGEWLDLLGVRDVTTLNHALLQGRSREISLVSEALQAQKIAEIASRIFSERKRLKIVLIAGPSSSGKTTFTHRLAVQLLANGLHPYPISLDNYFLPRAQTPRSESGEHDFECLQALNLERFNHDLTALIAGESCTLPRYNFITGESVLGDTVQLTPGHVLLIEGIHGLNPELVAGIPAAQLFRIYASALTQLKLDRLNRISTTDTRLIRRIVRDAATRGYSAQATIARWSAVVRGEDEHIFPFQENADVMFNSALVYELAALKPLAEPLLRQVEPGTPGYVEARRLLAFLQWFKPFDSRIVPEESILREFIGNSAFSDEKYPLHLV